MKSFFRAFAAAFLILAVVPTASALSMKTYQGRYFRGSVPAGWHVNETQNGLEIIAPDNVTAAAFTLLMGAFGQTTPRQYLAWSLRQGPYGNPRILYVKDLPDQAGIMQFNWKVIEAEVTFIYRNVPVRAHVVAGVIQGYGQYSAVLRAYQAPQSDWKRQVPLLTKIDDSIVITNPTQVAGAPQMHLPKGIRADDIYGDYNKAYNDRQKRHDVWAQKQNEANRGYGRMKDPETGQIYDMTPDQYDPTVGGYRNPKRPTELLEHAAPGE